MFCTCKCYNIYYVCSKITTVFFSVCITVCVLCLLLCVKAHTEQTRWCIHDCVCTRGNFSTFYPILLYFFDKKLSGMIPMILVQFIFFIGNTRGPARSIVFILHLSACCIVHIVPVYYYCMCLLYVCVLNLLLCTYILCTYIR